MSHHDIGNGRMPVESETIERVIAALSEPVTVRPAFRAELLAAIDRGSPRPKRLVPARWSFPPVAAVAAALGCVMVGATMAALVLGRAQGVPHTSDVPAKVTTTLPAVTGHGAVSVVRFVFVAPNARRVSVVGDFNRWNPSAMPMRRSADGRAWLLDIPLTPGRHVYSFSVDGDLAPDPAAPQSGDDDFGVPSSVVLVGGKA